MMYADQLGTENSPNVFFFKPDFQTFGRARKLATRLERLPVPAEPGKYYTWKVLAPTNLGFWNEE